MALGQVEAAARIVKAPVIVAPYVGLGRHELGRLGRPCRQTEAPRFAPPVCTRSTYFYAFMAGNKVGAKLDTLPVLL